MVLGEALNPLRLLAVAVGFAGALLVVRPSAVMDAGLACALGSVACWACYMVVTRAVAQAGSPLATLAFQYAAGLLLLLAPALLHRSVPTASASLLILLMGLVSAACHMLVITAFRLARRRCSRCWCTLSCSACSCSASSRRPRRGSASR